MGIDERSTSIQRTAPCARLHLGRIPECFQLVRRNPAGSRRIDAADHWSERWEVWNRNRRFRISCHRQQRHIGGVGSFDQLDAVAPRRNQLLRQWSVVFFRSGPATASPAVLPCPAMAVRHPETRYSVEPLFAGGNRSVSLTGSTTANSLFARPAPSCARRSPLGRTELRPRQRKRGRFSAAANSSSQASVAAKGQGFTHPAAEVGCAICVL